MPKEAFDVFCPNCNIFVEAKVIAQGLGRYRSEAVSDFAQSDAPYHADHYSVALCLRCDSPFLIREVLYGVPGEFETVTEQVVLYPVQTELRLEGLPDSISRSLTQAHRCYSTSSYDACALMCRRALEALCKSLPARGKGLAQKLDELEARGHIDRRLREWAHGVRLVGNEAAHDVDSAVTAEDARDILEFTEALLMYVFTLDRKFREFESRRKRRTETSSGDVTQQDDVAGGP